MRESMREGESGREVFALWGMDLGLGLGIPGTSFDGAMGGALGRSCLIDSASLGRSSLES